jgi:hypothetical protein
MAMSKEEREVFIDLYQDMLDKIYDELAEIAESIQKHQNRCKGRESRGSTQLKK